MTKKISADIMFSQKSIVNYQLMECDGGDGDDGDSSSRIGHDDDSGGGGGGGDGGSGLYLIHMETCMPFKIRSVSSKPIHL